MRKAKKHLSRASEALDDLIESGTFRLDDKRQLERAESYTEIAECAIERAED